MRWKEIWRGPALVGALALALSFTALEPAGGTVDGASDTPQLRRIVINGVGDLVKMLREIEARKAKPPRSDLDVTELIILYWGPRVLKNDIVPKMKRAGGNPGLRSAATRFFSHMACWGLHSADMIKEAYAGDRRGAERERARAQKCLARARIAQQDVSRLLRETA